MIQDHADDRLVEAINANDWNEICRVAADLDLSALRKRANFFQDKIDSELILRMIFGDDKPHQEKMGLSKLSQWLDRNQDRIENDYMRSFLKSFPLEGSREEIKVQTFMLEELTRKFPHRWETYISLACTWVDDKDKSSQFLRKAQELAPNMEIVFIWSMVLSQDSSERQLEYGDRGYAINKNNIFLILMARRLELLGKVSEARDYYQKIISDEPEDSYIRKVAKKELKSGCFIATLVYRDKYASEVETLRFVRDRLSSNVLGRSLIRIYYYCSPTLAEYLRNRPSLIRLTRFLLNSLLRVLEFLGITKHFTERR